MRIAILILSYFHQQALIVILIETPVGSSLQATADRVKEVENVVAATDRQELDSFVTRIGTFGEIGSSEREDNAAISVRLTPYNERQRTVDDVIEDLRDQLDNIDGIKRIRFIVDAGGPPVGSPILIRVVGPDDEQRITLADEIETYVKQLPGTKDIDRNDKEGKQQVELKFNYELLATVSPTFASSS